MSKLMHINFAALEDFSDVISIDLSTDQHNGTDVVSVRMDLLRDGCIAYTASDIEPPAPGALARTLATRVAADPLFKHDLSGTPLRYDGTRWIHAKSELNAWGSALKAVLGVRHDKSIAKEGWMRDVLTLSHGKNPPIEDEFSSMGSCPGIPLQDGVLVWTGSDFELQEHSPAHKNMYVLPVNSTKLLENARYPEKGLLRKFFDENLGEADRAFLPQWFGLHLIQHTLDRRACEFFLLLKGDGGNGKSVIVDMISGLVGEKAVASESLDGLNERTSHQLIGKVAMLAPENKGTWDMKILNALVSQEKMPNRPLYCGPAPFRPRVLVTQACNRLPIFNTRDRALERRMIAMELNKIFDTSQGVIQDLGKVIAAKEYAALAGMALWGARQILENGGKLTVPEELTAAGQKIARNGVQIEEMAEHLEFGEFVISKKELLAFYLDWAAGENKSKHGMNMSTLITDLQTVAARDHGPVYVRDGVGYGVQRLSRMEGYSSVAGAATEESRFAERTPGHSPLTDERGNKIRLAKREELIYGVRIKADVVDSLPVGIEWPGGPRKQPVQQQELPIQTEEDREVARLEKQLGELKAKRARKTG